jgi:hypothetical protein
MLPILILWYSEKLLSETEPIVKSRKEERKPIPTNTINTNSSAYTKQYYYCLV